MTWPRQDLVAFVASIVGWQDAEDIVQDVAVKLLTAEPVFPNALAERAWLYRVAKHAAIDYLRHRGSRPEVSLTDLPQHPVTVDATDDRERLWDASDLLCGLTEEECDWLAAYAYYGSWRAAAKALGVPLVTLYDRVSRVRAKLDAWKEDR